MSISTIRNLAIAADAVCWGALVFFSVHFFTCPLQEERRMKVYIVFEYHQYEESRIIAVFDSEEKAQGWIYHHYPDDDSVWWYEYEEYKVQ